MMTSCFNEPHKGQIFLYLSKIQTGLDVLPLLKLTEANRDSNFIYQCSLGLGEAMPITLLWTRNPHQ